MPHRKAVIRRVRLTAVQNDKFIQWTEEYHFEDPSVAARFCLELAQEYTHEHCPNGQCRELIAMLEASGHPVLKAIMPKVQRCSKFHQESGKHGIIWPDKAP